MLIRVGYDFRYTFPRPTPLILTLGIHYSRASDLLYPDYLRTDPPVPIRGYRDGFGHWCSRLVASPGAVRIFSESVVRDTGLPDRVELEARQVPVEDLPEETLVFLLGSRYCETDLLSETAWRLFGSAPRKGRRGS